MNQGKTKSAATIAREAAGLTLEQAAKKAGISVEYLRRIERRGAPFVRAERLAAIYGCRMEVFLFPHQGSAKPNAKAGSLMPFRDPAKRNRKPE